MSALADDTLMIVLSYLPFTDFYPLLTEKRIQRFLTDMFWVKKTQEEFGFISRTFMLPRKYVSLEEEYLKICAQEMSLDDAHDIGTRWPKEAILRLISYLNSISGDSTLRREIGRGLITAERDIADEVLGNEYADIYYSL